MVLQDFEILRCTQNDIMTLSIPPGLSASLCALCGLCGSKKS